MPFSKFLTVALMLVVFAICWLVLRDDLPRLRLKPRTARQAEPQMLEPDWGVQIAEARAGQRTRIVLETRPVSSAELAGLVDVAGALTELRVLTGVDQPATPMFLGTFAKLRVLHWNGPFGDSEAAQLAMCQELRVLNLPNCQLSDAGLRSLTELPRLSLLRISSPRLTDDGLAYLQDSGSLRFLHLINVNISDTGLSHLYGLHLLESFYLDGPCRVTDDGLHKLLKALPELHFHRDQQHL